MKKLLKSPFKVGACWVAAFLLAATGRSANAQNLISNYNGFLSALHAAPIHNLVTITNFQTNLYLALSGNQTVAITKNVLIDGGTNAVVFDGSSAIRIFTVASGVTLTLNNLQLLNGLSTNGGAIYNNGTLIISNCIISGNAVTNVSGVSGSTNSDGNGGSGGNGASAEGGAIYSRGPLFIYNSVLGTNSAIGGDGGTGGSGGLSIFFGDDGGNAGSGGNALGAAVFSTGSSNVFVSTEFFNNVCTAGSAGNAGAGGGSGALGGIGGTGANGGSASGGGVYLTGAVYVTNCVFAENTVTAGAAGADLSGNNNGFDGGTAEGGGLFLPPSVSKAYIENTVFFDNVCTAGSGGSGQVDGGNGGGAVGGGLASAAALAILRNCTLASNTLAAGTNGSGTTKNGSNGGARGWDLSNTGGILRLSGSILSGGTNATANPHPNAAGVTDAGYNVSSDPSLVAASTNTLVNATNVLLDTLVSGYGNVPVGPGNVDGPPFETMDIQTNGQATAFVFGVPGLSFPATDGLGSPRGAPTSAGVFAFESELGGFMIDSNAPLISIDEQPTNETTSLGGTVRFTVSASLFDAYGNALGYQWQINNTNLPENSTFVGVTSPGLTVRNVTAADASTNYQVVISPSLWETAATSSPVALIISSGSPKITAQPASKHNVPAGSTVAFKVTATSGDIADLSYQWYMGTAALGDSSNEISGSSTASLTIGPATTNDSGDYYVVVTDTNGSDISAAAVLTVVPETTAPKVAFTSPAAGTRTANNTITGTASDIALVTAVNYWVSNTLDAMDVTTNAATLNGGTTATTWNITGGLLPGTNFVTVQSSNFSGVLSAPVTRQIFYQETAILGITVNPPNEGTVTGAASVKGDPAPSSGAASYIGEGYTLTAKPATGFRLASWMTNGVLAGTNATLSFVMQSGLVVAVNFSTNIPWAGEKTKPSVAITSPKASSRAGAPVLGGTASDAVAVMSVGFWITNVNNGARQVQTGLAVLNSGVWSITNTLLPGTNILTVQSSNFVGLASPLASVSFFYQVAGTFSLAANPPISAAWVTGTASVKGDPAPPAQTPLYIGEAYTLIAKPGNNWLLLNWSGPNNIGGTNLSLTFIMQSNVDVTVAFENNPFVAAVARYDGIFYPSDSPSSTNSGLINNLVLKTNGVYSGKMYLRGASYSLVGTFNSAGSATETINRSAAAGGSLTLALSLAPQLTPRQITGSVANANWNSTHLNLYAATTNINLFSNYTVLLSADTISIGAPPDYGYAVITNMAGMIHMSGALSDGATLAPLLEPVNEAGGFPVYASLTNSGVVLGLLSLDSVTNATVLGDSLIWFKPPQRAGFYSNGFTAGLDTEISPWPNGATLAGLFSTNAELDIFGGGLETNMISAVQLAPANKLQSAGGSANFGGGAVNPANGLVTLTFTNSSGKKVTASGVLLPAQSNVLGGGFFLGATNAGSFILRN